MRNDDRQQLFKLSVNGKKYSIRAQTDTPLLYVLREELRLNGPKYGCGLGQCGSCMILLDGRAVASCLVTIDSIKNQEITTLRGLAQAQKKLHPVQKSFIEEQAGQCGYCINGMIISAVSLYNENPRAEDDTIKKALNLHLCRCGSHARIFRAVKNAHQY